ncbi:MAG: molybdopterin-synthase adenylyltransferase MoeB [Acidobacteriota bacterium]|nr:molybdopterin-synthase adenylyltransferase MoeB [Acidobacteriota bacterium]
MTVRAKPSAIEQRRTPLSGHELRRYSRHLVLPEVGVEGQERLKASRALVVGAGGLGSPVGLYLAAAGVGTLGLVDFDEVDETNLHRQVLYGQSDIGRAKLEVALERLREINPFICLRAHSTRLDSQNAMEILADYDLVIDGSDNFATRYLVNDACVLSGKPNVYGSIFRFEGQVSVFWGDEGPCYRCLFPEPPPPGLVPSCAEGGVLGVLPGIVGSLQANEALKLLLGVGEPLVGRLVVVDALGTEFRELRLQKDPDCPVCGDHPSVTELIDYEAFCGVAPGAEIQSAPAVQAPTPARREAQVDDFHISPLELHQRLEEGAEVVVLDVRTAKEFAICQLQDASLIPVSEIPGRLDELATDRPLIVYCHHGPRSVQVVRFLRSQGFPRARNLAGGINAWSLLVDPSVPRY